MSEYLTKERKAGHYISQALLAGVLVASVIISTEELKGPEVVQGIAQPVPPDERTQCFNVSVMQQYENEVPVFSIAQQCFTPHAH